MLDQIASSTLPALDHYGADRPTHQLDELVTHSYRAFEEDADPRPLPEPEDVQSAVVGAMNALADVLADTRLEDDATDLLWSFVNIFHRRAEQLDRKLDENETVQRKCQREQDGSEVMSL